MARKSPSNWRRSLSLVAISLISAAPSRNVVYAQAPPGTTAAVVAAGEQSDACNSLSGPFCLPFGVTKQFSSYMTPVTVESLYEPTTHDGSAATVIEGSAKQCFFMHFSRSWMDSGGDENDLMSKQVRSVDECEALCCEHPQCQSFTFWMDTTCFLRARHNAPRDDGNSFSGNRIG